MYYTICSLYYINHDVIYFGVGNCNIIVGIALILVAFYIIQLVTGILLILVITTELDFALFKLRFVAMYIFYGWFISDLHMIGSNYVVWCAYFHMSNAGTTVTLSTISNTIWLSGVSGLILSILACFTGYILVCGQMSYWALIVILNLLTIIPLLDIIIINTILVGNCPSSWAISSITNLHFLIVCVIIVIFLIHLISIHNCRPGTLLITLDCINSLFDIIINDSLFLSLVVMCVIFLISLNFIHPDNYVIYSSIVTPIHIEPECYFLVLFALINARTLNICGVLFLLLGVVLYMSIYCVYYDINLFSNVFVWVIMSHFISGI